MTSKTIGGIRKPYVGDRRSLVLALDVGTTFSGVSYAFLNPGEVPKIHGVTRYPGQEHVTGNTKIPSILYYDRNGVVKAAGAEADGAQIEAQAEDEEWTKVELFKLRLRPKQMELDMNGMKMTPLPAKKSSETVFGDFLRYLFSCSRKFIEDTHANGKNLWKAVEKDIHFVLSHPNGWEGAQQSRMRRAASFGGLVADTDEGKARIRFVTEGEASMHACILSGLAADVLATGNGFIVADAGGGTLDISSYVLKGTHPLIIEEVAPPDCLFAGAVFVSRRARVFLEEKLKGSKYGSPDALDHITKRFDETTKRLFRDKSDPQYIHFGSPLDKDQKVGIRGGQLKLTGAEVAELFEPSIQAAVASITRQFEASRGVVKAVWLVGGFAASPWLFSQLQSRLSHLNIVVNRPDTQTSKAVADGAIGFFCDHHVSARISRFMYGVEFLREIDMKDQEHVSRQSRMLRMPSGPQYLPDAFDCILKKNVRVKESSVFSRKYYTEVTSLSALSVFEIEIWCYRGGEDIPKWIERTSPQFGSLCFVRADLSKITNAAEPQKGPDGQTYWIVVFSIEIHFGLTEFKARMKYTEDGTVKYGPASIVFNEKGHRSDEDDHASIPDDDNVAKPRSRHPRTPKTSSSSRSSSSKSDATTVETIMIDPPSSPSSTSSKGKSKKRATSPLASPIASRASSEAGMEKGTSLDAAIDIVIPSKAPSSKSDGAPSNAASVAGTPATQPAGSSLAPARALSSSGSGQSDSPKPSPTDTLVDSPKSPAIAARSSVNGDKSPATASAKPEAKADEKKPEVKDLPPPPAPSSDAQAAKSDAKEEKKPDVAPPVAKTPSTSEKAAIPAPDTQTAKSDAKDEKKPDVAPAVAKTPSTTEKVANSAPSAQTAKSDAKEEKKSDVAPAVAKASSTAEKAAIPAPSSTVDAGAAKSETTKNDEKAIKPETPAKTETGTSAPKVDDKPAQASDAPVSKTTPEAPPATPASEAKAASPPSAPAADVKTGDAPTTPAVVSKPSESPSAVASDAKPAETPAADAKTSGAPGTPSGETKPAETPAAAADVKPKDAAAIDAKPSAAPAVPATDAKPAETPSAPTPENKPADTPGGASTTAADGKPGEVAVTVVAKADSSAKPDEKPTAVTDGKSADALSGTPPKVESATPAATDKPKEEPKDKVDSPAKAATNNSPPADKANKVDAPSNSATSEKPKDEAAKPSSDKPKAEAPATSTSVGTSPAKDEAKNDSSALPTPPSAGKTDGDQNTDKDAGKGKGKGKGNKGPTPPKKGKGKGNAPSMGSAPSNKSDDADSKEKEKKEESTPGGWGSPSGWGESKDKDKEESQEGLEGFSMGINW